MMWIYVMGQTEGVDVKIGHTEEATVWNRLKSVNGEANDDRYVLLASVRSQKAGENATHKAFKAHKREKGKGDRNEYFYAVPEITEWVRWLRQQWFVGFDPHDTTEDVPDTHYAEWIPGPARRVEPPPTDPERVVQDHEQLHGQLAGTAWKLMPDMEATFQDYFTDPWVIECAGTAMGGIDGDAASHWIAQKRLRVESGIVIPEYLHTNRSAFTHDWFPRTWLNPPYGENEQWFTRALEQMDAGNVEQLCMLSPIYAFNTAVAREIMGRSSAAVILSPTPKFFNPGDPTATGTNLPHAVVYWGDRKSEFLDAYRGRGIPFLLAWQT